MDTQQQQQQQIQQQHQQIQQQIVSLNNELYDIIYNIKSDNKEDKFKAVVRIRILLYFPPHINNLYNRIKSYGIIPILHQILSDSESDPTIKYQVSESLNKLYTVLDFQGEDISELFIQSEIHCTIMDLLSICCNDYDSNSNLIESLFNLLDKCIPSIEISNYLVTQGLFLIFNEILLKDKQLEYLDIIRNIASITYGIYSINNKPPFKHIIPIIPIFKGVLVKYKNIELNELTYATVQTILSILEILTDYPIDKENEEYLELTLTHDLIGVLTDYTKEQPNQDAVNMAFRVIANTLKLFDFNSMDNNKMVILNTGLLDRIPKLLETADTSFKIEIYQALSYIPVNNPIIIQMVIDSGLLISSIKMVMSGNGFNGIETIGVNRIKKAVLQFVVFTLISCDVPMPIYLLKSECLVQFLVSSFQLALSHAYIEGYLKAVYMIILQTINALTDSTAFEGSLDNGEFANLYVRSIKDPIYELVDKIKLKTPTNQRDNNQKSIDSIIESFNELKSMDYRLKRIKLN